MTDQQRIFAPGSGRRIVLATNVAETSLTVPGIRYVIDTGLARVKRYSLRNKTTLLQIEKVSQAAANQRAGRCGRVAEGICVRLYDEDDFAARPKFTDPEILRSSLAAVILRMASLDLPVVEEFPFLEPPGPRAIADGYQLLQELGAVDDERRSDAARPRTRAPAARSAHRPHRSRCARHGLPARGAGDRERVGRARPRERPLERQQAADQAHLKFRDERSDFLSLVALWEFFGELEQKQSHRRLVDGCRAQFVSYLRLREWRDVHQQLAPTYGGGLEMVVDVADDDGRCALRDAAQGGVGRAARQHRRQGRADTALPRRARPQVLPASGFRTGAQGRGQRWKWILAAELTETSRLFARCAARVEPEWIEEVAGERVTRDHFEPHWEEKRGEVVASEKVSLYGLTLVARRPVSFGAIDAKLARDVFIREALVPGALATKGAFPRP